MDDERNRAFVLDTSIILPIAIATSIAAVIIIFLYCCRRYQGYMNQNGLRDQYGRSFGNTIDENEVYRDSNRRSMMQQHRTQRNTSSPRFHFMPWPLIRHSYHHRHGNVVQNTSNLMPQPHNTTNYNSTQVGDHYNYFNTVSYT